MNHEMPDLSNDFRRLYFDATAFDSFSAFHPISFRRVLPFQSQEQIVDNRDLISAEEAYLADKGDDTRRRVIDEYLKCALLQETDAANLKAAVDFLETDFFEIMGLVYANAGMFRCALRWYREAIRVLETEAVDLRTDEESVYASVGYCLYSLSLFQEAISWSKSCIGPRPIADALCQALIVYEVGPAGGMVQAAERSGPRMRYTISAPEPLDIGQTVSRLKIAMEALVPFQEVYIDWIGPKTSSPGIPREGYPFKNEFDASSLLRHKMNLLFATCGQADALVEKGYHLEAKRLLYEALMLEREASVVRERLNPLP